MAELSEKNKGIEELLEKIPPEKRWDITAKTLWRFKIMRGDKLIAPELGVGKDIISPLWSKEKWDEINEKITGDAGKKGMPMVKDMFNIPVEDAVGAAKLLIVFETLLFGPEAWWEIVEVTPERAVFRAPECWCWEMYNEFEVEHELRPCDVAEQSCLEKGYEAINPKITYKLTKALPWGDPYCESIIEFKNE